MTQKKFIKLGIYVSFSAIILIGIPSIVNYVKADVLNNSSEALTITTVSLVIGVLLLSISALCFILAGLVKK